MKSLLIKTLGCKVNQCESESIRNALVESGRGFTSTQDGAADVVIVNTCTVTRKAAMQSRQAVRKAIRANPSARIVVTGCHAQTAPAELTAIDGVDLIVSNRDKHHIAQLILSGMPANTSKEPPAAHLDRDLADDFAMMPAIAHGSRTRPYLKIQDGCDAYCTYCIVPYARGKSRSLPMDQVLQQINQLGQLGYREVVLTGIHIGCYGQDLSLDNGLYDLLCRIQDAGSIDRVRISSIEPAELSENIIRLAQVDDGRPGRLCPHFHIPLQSGDDTILKRMHRPYRRDDFKALIHTIIDRLPHAAIGVDTLVGFPGETHDAFENTVALIHSLPVAYLHVFPFSAREGTPAFSFKNQITASQIKNRCARMRQLGAQKRDAFYARWVDETVTVLVEATRDRASGCLKGLTANYIPVHFDGSDDLYNTFQQVDVRRLSPEGVPLGSVGR